MIYSLIHKAHFLKILGKHFFKENEIENTKLCFFLIIFSISCVCFQRNYLKCLLETLHTVVELNINFLNA